MQYDQALAELRCSVFHLTDETMRGYYEAIRARGIRYIHGYPSAIAVLWFIIILLFVAVMSRLLRQRDKLEF